VIYKAGIELAIFPGPIKSILLLSYVSFQFSYDNFHDRKQEIYRVNLDIYQNNLATLQTAETYSAVGPALKKDFPESEQRKQA
jgi:putative ABC transport system permease protein